MTSGQQDTDLPILLATSYGPFRTDRPRFLSEADCHDIAARLARATRGGGLTTVKIHSLWTGSVRWGRNRVRSSSEIREDRVHVERNVLGAQNENVEINQTTDRALVAAVRRAERLMMCEKQNDVKWEELTGATVEAPMKPAIFSEATYNLGAEQRAAAAVRLMKSASDAGMLSAGYLQVSAHSKAVIDTLGRTLYCQYTWAQYSVTVRDPQGTGSGWAGQDRFDWTQIDADHLSAVALDKCLRSRNPVRVEPGRYTTILEPQAVSTLIDAMIFALGGHADGEHADPLWRVMNELPIDPKYPYFIHGSRGAPTRDGNFVPGMSKLGERLIDERLSIWSDPMDPDVGVPAFNFSSYVTWRNMLVNHPGKWFTNGVLTALAYPRDYGVEQLGLSTGLPSMGAYRMTGGTTTIEEMIATTKRGLLVTRFDQVSTLDFTRIILRGYTRDGLWLIENGKITKSVKNLVFTEGAFFALNRVEQLGMPQRVFHPAYGTAVPHPVVVPPLKIRDFSFTSLTDAV